MLGGVGANDYILGNGGTLTLDQPLSGFGTFGNCSIVLVNNSTINANVSGQTLLINPSAASTNTKVMEATNGGTLELSGVSWTNTGATITAATGSSVILNSTSITGGTLSAVGTGTINSDNVSLNTLTTSGNFIVGNNTTTTLTGTITNNGTMTLNSTGNTTELSINGNVTLAGTGSVILGGTGTTNDYILGSGGSTLTIDQPISGFGTIGNSSILLVNKSMIDSNGNGDTLVINPSGASTNAKIMEATAGGTLELEWRVVDEHGRHDHGGGGVVADSE